MKTSKYGVHVHDMHRSVELQGIKLKCLMAVFWYIKGYDFELLKLRQVIPLNVKLA